jgi:hypothetical protein
LSQAIMAFVIDYESGADTSLPSAAVFQAISDDGTPARDLPPLHGWTGHGFVRTEATTDRGTVVHLTERGKAARDDHLPRAAGTEDRWRRRFGARHIGQLRTASEAITLQLDPIAPHTRVISIIAGIVP